VISKKIVLAVVAIAIPASVMAQSPPVAQRQALMKAVGGQMRDATRFASGQTPFDAAKVNTLMTAVAGNATKAKTLFPDNSASDPKSTALPKLWKEKAAFNKRFDEMAAFAKAAGAAKTPAAYKVELQKLGGTCKGCHDAYRKAA